MDAKPFAHELALLPELPQREVKLLERLRDLPPDAAVELLHGLVVLAGEADAEGRIALQVCACIPKLEGEIGYHRFTELYLAADDRGYDEVKRMLSREVKTRAPKDGIENEFVERTLGERTALARTSRDRDLLDRLMKDRNPKVIHNLLLNARLVERDVVAIAAARPTSPAVLEEVLRSKKWNVRYAVKKALALNPYLPVGEAVTLLPHLTGPDLQQVSESLEVAESVRSTAREILARRHPESSSSSSN